MKFITALFLLTSVSSFAAESAKVGEGVQPGCNPSEWTCDPTCQAKKAAACGLNTSEFNAKNNDGGAAKNAKGGSKGTGQ